MVTVKRENNTSQLIPTDLRCSAQKGNVIFATALLTIGFRIKMN